MDGDVAGDVAVSRATDRVLAVALWLAALAFVAHRALQPLAENDLFFHLAIGDRIRADHAIPFRNLYSFTYPDHPDPDLSWGFQVLVSWLHAHGGFPAIVACKSALIVVAAALQHHAARLAGASPLPTALATTLAICAADQRLVERPHLVTFVGLGVLAILLEHVRRGRPRLLWAVPAIATVWANFHAGVFLCVVILVLFLVERSLVGRAPLPAWRAGALVGLTALGTFLTPAGTRLPAYLLWHTGLGSTRVVEEFRRVTLYSDPFFFVCAALALVGVVRLPAQRLRVLPILIVGALAARSVRFAAEWALLATPFLALAIDGLRDQAFAGWRRGASALVTVGLIALVLVERRQQGPFSIGLSSDVVPFRAIEFVTRNGLRERMYADLDVGCYLLWEGWPRYRVFQDARLPAYPDAFHRSLDETPLEPAAFDALLARHGVDSALLADPDINMRAGSFDPERWALVYRARDALVFVRRLDRYRAVILEHELPLRVRFRWLGGSSVEALPRPPAGSPVGDCRWRQRLVRALVEEGRPVEAVRAYVLAREVGCVPAR